MNTAPSEKGFIPICRKLFASPVIGLYENRTVLSGNEYSIRKTTVDFSAL